MQQCSILEGMSLPLQIAAQMVSYCAEVPTIAAWEFTHLQLFLHNYGDYSTPALANASQAQYSEAADLYCLCKLSSAVCSVSPTVYRTLQIPPCSELAVLDRGTANLQLILFNIPNSAGYKLGIICIMHRIRVTKSVCIGKSPCRIWISEGFTVWACILNHYSTLPRKQGQSYVERSHTQELNSIYSHFQGRMISQTISHQYQ